MEPPGFIRLTNDYGDPNAESRETLQAAGNLNLCVTVQLISSGGSIVSKSYGACMILH